MIAAERVGFILDVIDRKIVIAALFEVGDYSSDSHYTMAKKH